VNLFVDLDKDATVDLTVALNAALTEALILYQLPQDCQQAIGPHIHLSWQSDLAGKKRVTCKGTYNAFKPLL
jgi:hypothetical protein